MSQTISTKDYAKLYAVYIQTDSDNLVEVINENGCHNWTVCPTCGMDDFSHAQDCLMMDPEHRAVAAHS